MSDAMQQPIKEPKGTKQAGTTDDKLKQPKKKQPKVTTYLLHNTDIADLNRTFYQAYDENFLYSKALALTYIAYELGEQQEHFKQQVEKMVGTYEDINDKFFESLRAEIYFTAIHQFECLFSLLMALYQPDLPHWFYLSEYKPGEMREAAELFVNGEIGRLTGVKMSKRQFVSHAIYSEFTMTGISEERWNENLDNISWLLGRIAEQYIKASEHSVGEYNAYKHGLRVMTTGPSVLSVQLQSQLNGDPTGPRFIVGASNDAFRFLQMEKDEKQNGKIVHQVIKHFSPRESFFFICKMRQMLDMVKRTRLAHLTGENLNALNTFFDLDKNHVMNLRGDNTSFSFTI